MEETIKYTRGRNPNSLANLKLGGIKNSEMARRAQEAGQRSAEVKRIAHTIWKKMMEETQRVGEIDMTKIEIILRQFANDVNKNPTPQKIEMVLKLMDENETTINVNDTPRQEYEEIPLPKEEKVRLAMAIMEHTRKR